MPAAVKKRSSQTSGSGRSKKEDPATGKQQVGGSIAAAAALIGSAVIPPIISAITGKGLILPGTGRGLPSSGQRKRAATGSGKKTKRKRAK